MESNKTVEDYILNAKDGRDILTVLRKILKKTELKETVKWGAPVYTLNNKNIVGIGAFKSYAGLWFFHGALLQDKAGVLINAQENVTKALRQWRFSSVEEINETLILEYIKEAIKNQKQGKEIKANRKQPIIIPEELKKSLEVNGELKSAFNQLTPGCKREYANYIGEAKKSETRIKRVQKVIPMILQKKGLNDKYRN